VRLLIKLAETLVRPDMVIPALHMRGFVYNIDKGFSNHTCSSFGAL
jgi:hypothetical protein